MDSLDTIYGEIAGVELYIRTADRNLLVSHSQFKPTYEILIFGFMVIHGINRIFYFSAVYLRTFITVL